MGIRGWQDDDVDFDIPDVVVRADGRLRSYGGDDGRRFESFEVAVAVLVAEALRSAVPSSLTRGELQHLVEGAVELAKMRSSGGSVSWPSFSVLPGYSAQIVGKLMEAGAVRPTRHRLMLSRSYGQPYEVESDALDRWVVHASMLAEP